MRTNPILSVVIPAYNEEQSISLVEEAIRRELSEAGIRYEIVFVDDGSRDRTWEQICTTGKTKPNVRGVHFSRNFGKEAAILAGLEQAIGDCCVVIDSDLQHPPETIVEMYQLWQEGFEVIEAQKTARGKETAVHGLAAKCFYALISKAAGFDMANASDFKLLDRKAVDALLRIHEHNSFFRALSCWIGYRTATVQFEVRDRVAGESKWSTRSLVKYALNNIASFSAAPMQLVTILGVLLLIVSVVLSAVALVQKLSGVALGGFTTLILLLSFSSSIIMISLGIIGYYIAKIYEEVKGRPRYLISDLLNPDGDSASDISEKNNLTDRN